MGGEQSAIEDAPKPSRRITLRAAVCTVCGHSLRGLSPDRSVVTCPECGALVQFVLKTPDAKVGAPPPVLRRLSAWLLAVLIVLAIIVLTTR